MRRLVDDPNLASELRAELERSQRAGHDYDALAKLPQLRAALNAPRAVPGAEAEAEFAGHLKRVMRARMKLGSSGWKLVLLVASVGALVAVAWPARQRHVAPQHSAHTDPAPAVPTSTALPMVAKPDLNAKVVQDTPTHEVVAPESERDLASPDHTARREIAQLVRIRALLEHDPAAAYRLALRSEREFPRGLLTEERQALQILALAKSGAWEAANRNANEFLARYPHSPVREQLEAALRR